MGYILDKYHKHFCDELPRAKVLNKHFKSFTVAVFSVFALIFAGLNVLVVKITGVEDPLFKDLAYVISALLVILCFVGLYSIHYPRKEIPRFILIACWLLTSSAVTALSIWEMNLLLSTKKAAAKDVCQKNLLSLSEFKAYSPNQDPILKDVETCYKFVVVAAGGELSFQVMGTIIGMAHAWRYQKRAEKIPKIPK
ncbi:hypothetical protein BGX26_005442 [Mortierella sp. AD094]|nr:hypothetical protein BGX26_005442 [Mortierella sp. AD094]